MPQAIAAAGPREGRLSKEDRALIATAKTNGKDTITVLIAAQPDVQVRTDANVLIGQGDVIVQTVTP